MNKEFLNWIEKQEYDWDISYNQRHRIQGGGRIWMLKNVYNVVYDKLSYMKVEWERVIDDLKHE